MRFSYFSKTSILWWVTENNINQIAHIVKEKTDGKEFIYQITFQSPDIPKLCVLRHLLIFTHCSNHRKGTFWVEDPQPHCASDHWDAEGEEEDATQGGGFLQPSKPSVAKQRRGKGTSQRAFPRGAFYLIPPGYTQFPTGGF